MPASSPATARLPRSIHGLDGAPEWPTLRALLPDLRGLRVLDLGCGFGWFCRFARAARRRERPRDRCVGAHAGARPGRDDAIDGDQLPCSADLEQLTLAPAAFDLAYQFARAALHRKSRRAARACFTRRSFRAPQFIFSVEHPIYTAPADPGWVCDARRPQDLAGRPLSRRGPAHDRLARQGRDQAAPHHRDVFRAAAASRLRRDAYRRMGAHRPSRSPRSRSLRPSASARRSCSWRASRVALRASPRHRGLDQSRPVRGCRPGSRRR